MEINIIEVSSIEKVINNLPAVPAVVNQLLIETSDPDTSPSSLENLICSDQAITAKLLKVVNSPFYGYNMKIGNVKQACLILGVEKVRSLALTITLFSHIQGQIPRQSERLNSLWKYSMAAAISSQKICEYKRLSSIDTGYISISSLLHNLGRLLLFSNFYEKYERIISISQQNNESVSKTEIDYIGLTNGQIGATICRKWRFPNLIADIIEDHEGDFKTPSAQSAYPVHISSEILKIFFLPDFKRPDSLLCPIALEWLNAPEGFLEEVAAIALVKVTEITNSLAA